MKNLFKGYKFLTDFWYEHYVSENHLCSLCAQSGVIDTTGIRSPAGVECGGKSWCICPNGQTMRVKSGCKTPQDYLQSITRPTG